MYFILIRTHGGLLWVNEEQYSYILYYFAAFYGQGQFKTTATVTTTIIILMNKKNPS